MAWPLRLASESDIPALSELIPISVRALSTGHYSAQQIESAIIHIFGVDSQLIADGTYYAAMDGETIVGCGGWSMRKTLYGGDQMKGELDDLLDPARDAARIRAFFVHPGWARRGIGRSIIERCEADARAQGFGRMELGATLPGEQLYAVMGYRAIEPFTIEMTDGVTLPCVHMTKVLAPAP
jgi:GNAT superfamily N-acetyltransferase